MKLPLILAIACTIAVGATSLRAGLASSVENEFLQLREKRDKALAVVAVPINDGYRASLEKRLTRAVAEKDKEGAAKIQFELQSIGAAGIGAPLARRPGPTPEMLALQQKLGETKWRITREKTFILHADGSSESNWTPRQGRWKVLDGTTVELDIANVPRKARAIVSQGETVITWADKDEDQPHPQVAKKIVPVPDK